MTLHIYVNFRFPVLDAYDRFKKHSKDFTGHDWNQALLRFQVLSLEKATVVINDYTFCSHLYNAIEKRHRLTVHEKRDCAKRVLSPELATDGANFADLDSAAQLREERRKGRKNRLRLFRQGVIQAKRSPRVLEAQAKLDAFHESLDRIAIWLAGGRLDEHSASFMMPGPYVSGFGDKLTDNDDHLLKTHLKSP